MTLVIVELWLISETSQKVTLLAITKPKLLGITVLEHHPVGYNPK